jgi:hypothetical protein
MTTTQTTPETGPPPGALLDLIHEEGYPIEGQHVDGRGVVEGCLLILATTLWHASRGGSEAEIAEARALLNLGCRAAQRTAAA